MLLLLQMLFIRVYFPTEMFFYLMHGNRVFSKTRQGKNVKNSAFINVLSLN